MHPTPTERQPLDAPLRGGACSAPGDQLRPNDDAVWCGPVWFAVADGMSGHPAGGVASRIAIEAISAEPPIERPDDVAEMVAGIDATIRAVARRAGTEGMGTTLVAATAVTGGIAVAHVGDSRCYRLHDGELDLVTRDHSHVQDLVDIGRISPDEARRHRLRNVITRALGIDVDARPDVAFLPSPIGRLLLCSDGLSHALSPETLGRVLAGIAEPQAAAERLVELAVADGASDDVTALVVDGS